MDTGDQQDLRTTAMRSLHRKAEFRRHLFTYAVVNLLLIAIWAAIGVTAGGWFPWPLFPIVFWGLGIVTQAWYVYGDRRRLTEDDVQREMQRLQDQQGPR
jgi:fatty acid desaturase